MPVNVFISFALENLEQVNNLRTLAQNPNYGLEFHDRSELEPVRDRVGMPLPYQPEDPRAAPIRKELKHLLEKSTKMVVIIGETTHKSKWVNWEIQTFYDKKSNLDGDPKKRIKGMYVKRHKEFELPRRLRMLGISIMNWNLENLNKWFKLNPNQ